MKLTPWYFQVYNYFLLLFSFILFLYFYFSKEGNARWSSGLHAGRKAIWPLLMHMNSKDQFSLSATFRQSLNMFLFPAVQFTFTRRTMQIAVLQPETHLWGVISIGEIFVWNNFTVGWDIRRDLSFATDTPAVTWKQSPGQQVTYMV
jgi:hypothetical protein